MRDTVITAVGAVTALGGDAPSTWDRVLAGESAIRQWPDLADEGFPVSMACRVDDGRLADPMRRGRDLAVLAAGEALRDTRLSEAGVFIGTTMGESAVFEAAPHTGSFDLRSAAGDVFTRTVAERFGLTGPQRTFGTACAAGNYAIGAAHRAVASGRVDAVLAGGVEPFSRIALVGFARMRAMAPDGCRPFAPARRGMTLGEGAAFVLVESREHAASRGATALARIGGLGLAADAHHPTAPREDGSGMAAAMRAGLKAADLSSGDIGWISAHGTGTPRSDAAEALALREVFGPTVAPVSSVKGALGHTLGAATAIEAVLSVLAMRDGVLPPNGGVETSDETLGLDVVLAARPSATDWVMSCGYAFGGLNSALLLGRP
jgi:3-oxoacyl-[acyl-carrier-protein] synthase II